MKSRRATGGRKHDEDCWLAADWRQQRKEGVPLFAALPVFRTEHESEETV